MFLYTKRSKKVIKWIWGVFALLVSLSMIFAFSGFGMLTSTPPQTQPIDIPPEVMESLRAQMESATGTPQNTPDMQALIEQLSESVADGISAQQTPADTSIEATATEEQDASPSVPELQFGL